MLAESPSIGDLSHTLDGKFGRANIGIGEYSATLFVEISIEEVLVDPRAPG